MLRAFGRYLLAAILWGLLFVVVMYPPFEGESPFFESWSYPITVLSRDIAGAEARFKTAHLADPTGHGAGEYASLEELSGATLVAGHRLDFLTSEFADDEPVVAGFCYSIWLPTGPHSAASLHSDDPASANLRETNWVAYAWPSRPEFGRAMFAIDQRGVCYRRLNASGPPTWDSLYGDRGWACAATHGRARDATASGWFPARSQ